MSRKLISAQRPFTMLVANLTGGSDPSKGVTGNPVVARSTFTIQHFPEVAGRGPEVQQQGRTPGLGTKVGLVDYTVAGVPVPAAGTITVASATFVGVTSILLGDYTLDSGSDFDVTAGTTYNDEDITNTVPTGALAVFTTTDLAGPNFIDIPVDIPITPSSVTITWSSGGVNNKTQTDDGVGGFAGDGTPGGSSIVYATGTITLDCTGDLPDNATAILITYTADVDVTMIATRIATAISFLPEYAATSALGVVTVAGPVGPTGNIALFKASGTQPQNLTFDPATGTMSGAEPAIGPVDIT
jgi:hypothetical protein